MPTLDQVVEYLSQELPSFAKVKLDRSPLAHPLPGSKAADASGASVALAAGGWTTAPPELLAESFLLQSPLHLEVQQGNLVQLALLLTQPDLPQAICTPDAIGYTPTQRAYECWRLTKHDLYLSALRLLFAARMLLEVSAAEGSVDSLLSGMDVAPGVPNGAVQMPSDRAILVNHTEEIFGVLKGPQKGRNSGTGVGEGLASVTARRSSMKPSPTHAATEI
eukprot:4916153-Prymnesium_polylepis.1